MTIPTCMQTEMGEFWAAFSSSFLLFDRKKGGGNGGNAVMNVKTV